MDASISWTYGFKDWDEPQPRLFIKGEGNHILACPRVPVRRLMDYDAEGRLRGGDDNPKNYLPVKYCEMLEQNQSLASCCRHPENHDIVAWYSSREDYDKGFPDVYIMICTRVHPDEYDRDGNLLPNPRPNKERWHARFVVGGGPRPYWA